jgi:hypothetical protein
MSKNGGKYGVGSINATYGEALDAKSASGYLGFIRLHADTATTLIAVGGKEASKNWFCFDLGSDRHPLNTIANLMLCSAMVRENGVRLLARAPPVIVW